ncbi:glutathione synthase/RimK-type ligase-like ATP-grasp enzyme [Actinoplanes lutulentus]|uniref:Glutathione synthetase-like protein n=1 Tax=Actinoplanes lutulentus TaxID=1287878 RepID=A0A327Z7S6_9ACTN|nr:hypothetical protein [Actinoplanes lutulentus]MBB2948550.1 glutathione synthase/RimK-type ligase-like ATP-grasp enzyme [Actinoplanes lutulentus]RAK34418.1 hypothetical protein B0I29_11117 [Actinoplanes lutulentus]
MRVALVTSERMPQDNWHDADSALLAAELERLGVTVDTPAWENEENSTDWADYDVLVLQSPWSMWRKLAEFDQWLAEREADGSRMLNPPDVLRIGSSKRYLTTLAEAGVVTVPTIILGPDAREQILRAYPRRSASRRTVVIKPLSSGGALDTREFTAERLEEAVAHAANLIDPETDPGLLLLEVEAVAPVKFFTLHPERAAAFAQAIDSGA